MKNRRIHCAALKVVAALAGVALFLCLLAFVFRPTINITLFKNPIENILTEVVESPVTVERVTLRPGAWVDVELHGLRIESTGADVTVEFALVERAGVRLQLLPLLSRELRLARLAADGVEVHLLRDRSEKGNWPVWKSFTWNITRLEGVEVRDARVRYSEVTSGREIEAEIEGLTGGISLDRPLSLEIHGSILDEPFAVSTTGGTLAELDRGDPWPIALSLTSKTLQLNLGGLLPTTDGVERGLSFDFALSDSDVASHPATERLGLPDLGAISFAGSIGLDDGLVELADLEGRFGRSDVAGVLRLVTAEERLRVTGELELGTLDLAPWIDAARAEEEDSASDPWEIGDLEGITFDRLGESLRALDTDLSFSIDHLLGLMPETTDLSFDVGLTGGSLEIPLEVRLGASSVRGTTVLDASGDVATLAVRFDATSVVPEDLAPVPADHALSGARIDHLEMTAASSGRSAAEHLRTLSLELDAGDMSLTLLGPEDEPWPLRLSEASLSQSSGDPLRAAATGALAGEPFSFDLETENLAALVSESSWPFSIGIDGGGARIDLNGDLESGREQPELAAEVEVSGPEIGRLAPWLGVSADAAYPYEALIDLTWSAERLDARLLTAQLGRSSITGRIAIVETATRSSIEADLHSPLVDVEEMLQVLGAVAASESDDDDLELLLDQRVLPSGIDLGEGSVDLRVDKVSGVDWQLVDIDLPLRLRDGRLERSSFSFGDGLATFTGTLALDLRGERPELDLELDARRADVERFLDEHEVDTGIDLTARAAHLELRSHGTTLREILSSGTVQATLEDVELGLASTDEDRGKEEATTVFLDKLTITDTRDGPFVLVTSGRLEELPIDLRLEADTSLGLLKSGALVPLRVEASTEGASLRLAGTTVLPLGSDAIDLELSLEGDRLDRFAPLVGRDLPAIGPYAVDARWKGGPTGDRLGDLQMTIGRTDLEGRLELVHGGPRPRLEIELRSDGLTIEDFRSAPVKSEESTGDEQPAVPDVPTLTARLDQFVTEDLLRTLDADLSVRLDELTWQERSLGGVELAIRLDEGRLAADFTRSGTDLPTSRAVLELGFEEGLIDARIAGRLLSIEYGLLDRIEGTDSGVAGSISADLDLRSTAPSFAEILANTNGAVAFTDRPRDINATILDLWGGQLLRGLLPGITGGDKSQLNCTVARLEIEAGRATPEMLFIDTTGSRIKGKGWIDLASGQLNLKLRPRPKQRGLINLSTTVGVRGSLMDPQIHFTAGGMAQTAFRLSLWFWTVWRELILRRPLPADGHDICVDPPPIAFTAGEAADLSAGTSSPRP